MCIRDRSDDGTELKIRRQLIENNLVEAIIILPRNLFYTTDISVTPVSYTHLDVYKRQGISQSEFLRQAIRRATIRPVIHVLSLIHI